jgi:uncharacterized protein (TIRG00374 family)
MISAHAAGAAALLKALDHVAPVRKVMMAMLAASLVGMGGDPKLGIPARLFFYKLFADIPLVVGVTQTVAESALWLLLMALIVAIPGPYEQTYALTLSLAALAILAASLLGLSLGPTFLVHIRGLRWVFSEKNRIGRFVCSVRAALMSMKFKYLLLACGWFSLTYVIDIASLWYLAHFYGYPLHPAILGHAIVLSYLVGALSLLPLGLGVRDIALAGLLVHAGLPEADAAACALIHRTIRTVLPLLLGALLIPYVSRYGAKETLPDAKSGFRNFGQEDKR